MRAIATEQDAIDAYGEGSSMHHWAREWLGRPRPPPVVLTRAAGAAEWPDLAAPRAPWAPFEIVDLDGGGALVPHFSTVKIEQLGWPEPRGGSWTRLELEC